MLKEVPNLTSEEVKEFLSQSVLILDIRGKESFSQAHIPKSINIPLSPAFAAWAKRVLPSDLPIIIVADFYPIQGVVDLLIRSGFVQILGVLAPFDHWEQSGFPVDKINILDVKNVSNEFIIDVRTIDEWNEGHIAGAKHIQIDEFHEKRTQIPKDQFLAIICASGNRASIFASMLKKEGYDQVANVKGGMMAWIEAKLPVVKHEGS